MNNPIKGRRADPKEKVNRRIYAVSRYKTVEKRANEAKEEDKARWLALLSPPLNKWFEYNGTTTPTQSQDR
jgi:hypothetical protein